MKPSHCLAPCLAMVLAFAGAARAAQSGVDAAEIDGFLSKIQLAPSVAVVKERCDAALALGMRARSALEARTGPATIEGDYAAFDALYMLLGDAASDAYLVSQTNNDAAVRDAAQACTQRLADASTDVSLSRPVYDRLATIAVDGLDAKTRFTLEKWLNNFRLAGVD